MIASIAQHRHLSHFIAKYRAVSRLRYCENFSLGQGYRGQLAAPHGARNYRRRRHELMRVALVGLLIWWALRIEGRVAMATAIALLRQFSEDPTSISR